MPFCLHLNILIFFFFFFLNSRWFCFPSSARSFSPGFLQKICLTWLFLSTELLPTELSLVSPLHPQSRGVQWNAWFTASDRAGRKMHTGKILTWSSREQQGLFHRVCCFFFFFCVVWSRVHQTQRIKTVLEQLLAQQNTVQWFVLLVHFGINKRPNEIKMKESEKGRD